MRKSFDAENDRRNEAETSTLAITDSLSNYRISKLNYPFYVRRDEDKNCQNWSMGISFKELKMKATEVIKTSLTASNGVSQD